MHCRFMFGNRSTPSSEWLPVNLVVWRCPRTRQGHINICISTAKWPHFLWYAEALLACLRLGICKLASWCLLAGKICAIASQSTSIYLYRYLEVLYIFFERNCSRLQFTGQSFAPKMKVVRNQGRLRRLSCLGKQFSQVWRPMSAASICAVEIDNSRPFSRRFVLQTSRKENIRPADHVLHSQYFFVLHAQKQITGERWRNLSYSFNFSFLRFPDRLRAGECY